jgi:hypothetical protein
MDINLNSIMKLFYRHNRYFYAIDWLLSVGERNNLKMPSSDMENYGYPLGDWVIAAVGY